MEAQLRQETQKVSEYKQMIGKFGVSKVSQIKNNIQVIKTGLEK
jgi:hypothetical protein